MALIRCSQCNTPLTGDETAAGKCPLCGASLGAPVERQTVTRREVFEAPQEAPSYSGRCLFCDELTDVRDGYVKVLSVPILRNMARALTMGLLSGGTVYSAGGANHVHVGCRYCQSCRRKVNRARWLGLWFLAIFFGYPALLCGGMLAVITPGQPGIDRVLAIATVSILVVWIVCPFVIHFYIKYRMRKILHPETMEWLKTLSVAWRPGFGSSLTTSDRRPNEEIIWKR